MKNIETIETMEELVQKLHALQKLHSDSLKESRGKYKKFFSTSILRFIRQTEEKYLEFPGIDGAKLERVKVNVKKTLASCNNFTTAINRTVRGFEQALRKARSSETKLPVLDYVYYMLAVFHETEVTVRELQAAINRGRVTA